MTSNLARSNLVLVALAMLAALASPAAADYESAVSAYESGAYDKAIGEFERLAEDGDERANFYLGMMHKDGKGTVANSVDALSRFICATIDATGLGQQAAEWRDQLTALMTGGEVAAANRKAQACGLHTSAKIGVRTGDAATSGARKTSAGYDRSSNFFGSSSSSPSGRTEFGKSPKPQWFLMQLFYFPARATINGAEFIADLFDLDALVMDLRHMANMRNDLFIALFALFWWFLIIKGVLRACAIGYDFKRGVGPAAADRSSYDKSWNSR